MNRCRDGSAIAVFCIGQGKHARRRMGSSLRIME